MPTTSNFGWTTPADTDLVKDGAAAIRTLGNGIDTSLVDLKGGTTGQILSKASNADLDYTWVNNDQGDITEVAAGTGISGGGTSGSVTITNSMATAIDAKGDLIVGTADNAFSRLASSGVNNQVLTVDTATGTGLKWAAPASPSFVGCSLWQSTNITVANDSSPVVTWDSERFDTDAFHSTSSNTSRITIPSGKGGKYLVIVGGAYAANATGYRAFSLRKNGSTSIELTQISPVSATIAPVFGGSTIVDLVATDYIEIATNQTSGGNLNFLAGITVNQFAVQYLGA